MTRTLSDAVARPPRRLSRRLRARRASPPVLRRRLRARQASPPVRRRRLRTRRASPALPRRGLLPPVFPAALPALLPAVLPALLLFLALGLAGCEAAAPAPFLARDSAGVRVVENRRPSWGEDDVWRLGEPLLDLGGPDAAGQEAFQWVTTAFYTDAGTLVAVESGGDIELFSDTGQPIRTAGRNGDGPGEFRMVAGAGSTGDTIWVYDYSHRRLTYLADDGALRSVHPLEDQELPLMPVGPLGNGFLLAATYQPGAASAAGRLGLRRDTVPYRLFGARGERGPVIARTAAREYVVGEEDGRLTMATPPFAHHADDATGHGVWVHGDESTRTLRVHGPDGALRTLIRWPGPPLEVTEAAVRREIERRIDGQAGDEAGLRRFLTELEHPDTRPAHGPVAIGPDGRIWVGTAPGSRDDGRPFETPGWNVFEADGRWLGTVAGPERFRITQLLADRVVGVWLDDMDVEHVQVRPLIRP